MSQIPTQPFGPFTTPSALLPNPLASSLTTPTPTLNLNQIENFQPIKEFIDETNTKWILVKSSQDSTIDIPDPKGLQVTDYWNHEFPNLTKIKLYVYVVEGIRPPRVETELPTRILYQWFSTVFVPNFTPQMITQREWLKANVYAASIVNARMSKLRAICKLTDGPANQPVESSNAPEKLLQVEELTNGPATK